MKQIYLCLLFWFSLLLHSNGAIAKDKPTIGITLQPYYSYVSAIVGDTAEVLPLVVAGFNPHNYQPQPEDLARVQKMDVIVVNGIGHDDFALKVIKAAQRSDLLVIDANASVPLLSARGQSVGQGAVNPHTFMGLSATMTQVYEIANQLAAFYPSNASLYRQNARHYGQQLRTMKYQAMQALAQVDMQTIKVATTHDAYGYLLQEFGIDAPAVIEPAHGVAPSASQLQDTINQIRSSGIDVLFYELDMPNRFVTTIEQATGVKLFRFSHMTHGDYEPEKVMLEMQSNINTLIEAIHYANASAQKEAVQ
ncbi:MULTISPECIES: zinc ABC transporter substrate-binding protein [unclassified Motilimonas]|uniref:metal ABC transporter solute-binding protein, Zn/Mn family n=1 Tax=Motilimonas TaxID=1914248 RepID=UPI001E28AB78|nr:MULTISPECIES: zinc ABC transporter substrate-binding protein [unclassified Motilimonas]MCE0558273.1 zinc ABC transporter substrate-binding protein [Motilimonas sp. E26]MDO6524637.1 zinc ABC transporter substrate-binding protein [Motilimonas sp. 1_MG-2023]